MHWIELNRYVVFSLFVNSLYVSNSNLPKMLHKWLYMTKWCAMSSKCLCWIYNSTGVYRPPGSGCSTPRTGPASVPAYTSVGSAEVRHGSSYTGHRIPWGGQSDVKMRGWPLGQYSYLVLSPHILRQPSHWLHWLHEPRQIWHWGDLGQTLTCFMSGTIRNLLTYEEGHQGTLRGCREGVISDEADSLLHYCPLEDGLEVWWEAGPGPAEEDQEEHRPGGGGHHGQTWVRGTSSDVTLT